MKRYLISFALLGFSSFSSANETLITLFECTTNKQQHLSLIASKGPILNFMRQGEVEYQQDIDKAYLHQYANGTQLMVPHKGKWYLFEETQATTGFTHVELVVRNAKTGQVLEYQECEKDVNSLITQLSTNDVKPIPDELAEWLFEVSNKYVP